MNVLGLLALVMLASKKAEPAAAQPPKPGVSAPAGVRVVGQVLLIPLRDGSDCIVAKLNNVGNGALDAIVIARGTVYGSAKGEAAVLRCGSESDAKAIAAEIRGKIG